MSGPASLPELLAPYRIVTVVGLAKNAGKTTVINHLLERLDGPTGLASLGLDGEQRDQLTGLAKPRIRPPADSLVVTTEGLAGDLRRVAALPFRTAVGEVLVVAPDAGRPVIVSGPARLDELDAAVQALFQIGARRVVLEGALGRLGTASPDRADAVVVAAGASAARSADDLSLTLRLAIDALDLPVSAVAADRTVDHAAGYEVETAAAISEDEVVELGGALTGPLLEQLIRAGRRATLVVADATRMLARPQQLARAGRAGVTVAARRPLPIAAISSSPFHPDVAIDAERAFAATVDAVAGRWPVYDVVSGMICA